MHCPFCGHDDSQVVDSRLSDPGDAVRRRRVCRSCERRFTTYERYDEGPLYIRKRGGQREPFERAKVLAGLERAAIKRPVEREQLEALVDRIVAELRSRGGTPGVEEVGELALRGLRELDAGRLRALRLRVPQVRGRRGVRARAGAARIGAAAAARAPLRAGS